MLTISSVLVLVATALLTAVLGNTHRIGDKSVRIPQYILGFITMVLLVVVNVIIAECNDKYTNQPSALDVYEGRTTLAITYVDSVPVDTTIVFKK